MLLIPHHHNTQGKNKMKVSVNAHYVSTVSLELDLPDGKTWNDVENCWVKWGKLYIIFKGETDAREYDMGDDAGETDWKRPSSVDVYDENFEQIDEIG